MAWRGPSPIVLACALAAVSVAAPGAQSVRRSMYVSVLDASGAPVPDLTPRDFVVREDNVAREVLEAVPSDDPLQVALLVDNSTAARDMINDLRAGLHAFVDILTTSTTIRGRNELAIITVADRPTIVAEYSTERTELDKGVDRIFAQPDSGAYLLDAIVEASNGLRREAAKRERQGAGRVDPVILAVTTEGPEFSQRLSDQVLKPLRETGAAFHVLAVGFPSAGLGDSQRHRGIVMDEGTRDSGGRFQQLLASSRLIGSLKELATELTHLYRVTWAHPPSLIPPEHVTVASTRPALTTHGTLILERD